MDICSNVDIIVGGGFIVGFEVLIIVIFIGWDGGGRGEGSNKFKF